MALFLFTRLYFLYYIHSSRIKKGKQSKISFFLPILFLPVSCDVIRAQKIILFIQNIMQCFFSYPKRYFSVTTIKHTNTCFFISFCWQIYISMYGSIRKKVTYNFTHWNCAISCITLFLWTLSSQYNQHQASHRRLYSFIGYYERTFTYFLAFVSFFLLPYFCYLPTQSSSNWPLYSSMNYYFYSESPHNCHFI